MRMTGGVGADIVLDFVGVTPTLTTAAACNQFDLGDAMQALEKLERGGIPGRAVLVP